MKRQQRIERRNNKLVAMTSVVGIVIVSLAILSYVSSPQFSPSLQRDTGGNLGGIGSGGNFGGDLRPTNPDSWNVFLTNDTFPPNLGGLADANGVCNAAARKAGLDGRYVAWLSSSSKDAKDRINDGKYVRIDGVKVADSKPDLLDGTLDASIEITEYGTGLEGDSQVGTVYTGTASDGKVIVGSNGYSTCGDWNSESSEDYAGVGILSETNDEWTNSFEGDCDYFSNVENAHLYCFEVVHIALDSGEIIEPNLEECSDGIDNDNDGLVDYSNDPGCLPWEDVPPELENTELGLENYPEFLLIPGTNKIKNLSIVYGRNASSSDLVTATNIYSSLKAEGYDMSNVEIVTDEFFDSSGSLLGKNYITVGKIEDNFFTEEMLEIYQISSILPEYSFLGLLHAKIGGIAEESRVVFVSGGTASDTTNAGKALINWREMNLRGKKLTWSNNPCSLQAGDTTQLIMNIMQRGSDRVTFTENEKVYENDFVLIPGNIVNQDVHLLEVMSIHNSTNSWYDDFVQFRSSEGESFEATPYAEGKANVIIEGAIYHVDYVDDRDGDGDEYVKMDYPHTKNYDYSFVSCFELPVLYYSFNEIVDNYMGSGNWALDYSGHDRGGAVYGPSRVAGKVEGGYRFDGINDEVKSSISEFDLPRGNITITAWVNPERFNGNNFRTILATYTNMSGGYGLRIVGDYDSEDTGKLAFFFRSNGDWHDYIVSESTIPLNEWTHVAMTYNGNNVEFYINGVRDSGHLIGDELIPLRGSRVGVLEFGNQFVDYWDGDLDAVRLYDRELAGWEIQRLYSGG